MCALLFPLIATSGARAEMKLTGYIPVEPEIFAKLPQVPRYRAFLPPKIDLSNSFPVPGKQSNESCSGWAVGYAARSYYSKTMEGRDTGKLSNVPSPAYIYNQIRSKNNCDSGAMLLDAFSVLGKGGLSGAEFPMQTCRIPTSDERKRATDFRIKRWLAVEPKQLDDVKGQLARGNPVIFGLDVRSDFEDLKGSAIYQGAAEKVGKHAMTLVGYDDQRQAFKAINSWGTDWGDKGFGWIGYDVFRTDAHEAYVMEIETSPTITSDATSTVPNSVPATEPSVAPVVEVPKPSIKPMPPQTLPQQVVNPSPPLQRPTTDEDCAYVYSDKSSGRTIMRGFVNSERDAESLRREWKGIANDFRIEVRPWPQCEVLLNVVSMLNDGSGLSVTTKSGASKFSEDQDMVFEVKTPVLPSYVYAFYVEADGNVITLLEPDSELAPSLHDTQIVFGSGDNGTPKFRAAKPFGREMVLALSSASPLFEEDIPKKQTEREFLSSLRRTLFEKSGESRRISAAIVSIETEARK